MSQPEPPNPEQKSNNAILCLCIGGLLVAFSWFLGVGGVLTTAIAGGNLAATAGGIGMLIALPLTSVVGVILIIVGAIWMFGRVIADQSEAHRNERYKDVQR
jgi:hypothetical protein